VGSCPLSLSVYAMTFPLVKPAGWTDGVDPITASEMSTLDANLASAIDGHSGGSYAPSAALQIGGSGLEISNCAAHQVRGNYSLNHAKAAIKYRVDRTTVNPATATEYRIDTSNDIYITSGPATVALVNVVLNVSADGYVAPADGARIIFRKHVNIPGPQTDLMTITIYNDDTAASSRLASFVGLSLIGGANPYITATFLFDAIAGEWTVESAEQRVQM